MRHSSGSHYYQITDSICSWNSQHLLTFVFCFKPFHYEYVSREGHWGDLSSQDSWIDFVNIIFVRVITEYSNDSSGWSFNYCNAKVAGSNLLYTCYFPSIKIYLSINISILIIWADVEFRFIVIHTRLYLDISPTEHLLHLFHLLSRLSRNC